jgi:hypothetical protein
MPVDKTSSQEKVSSIEVGDNQTASDRPLIIYAYYETENARQNLEYFLAHGLHGAADFIFILNGDNHAEGIIPTRPNIRYIKRENDCYDLGAFAEVLTNGGLYRNYKKFITMNASIRGPFLPYLSTGCWSDMFLSRVTEEVKVGFCFQNCTILCLYSIETNLDFQLVGMTVNCQAPVPHIQSMIWATDRVGIETLLFPTEEQIDRLKGSLPPRKEDEPVPEMESPGINSCPHEYWKAVAIEVYATPLLKAAGYKIDAMMAAFHGSENYEDECTDYMDVVYEGAYFGMNLHPYDSIFTKANRGGLTGTYAMEKYSEWMKARKYSSYDYCHS